MTCVSARATKAFTDAPCLAAPCRHNGRMQVSAAGRKYGTRCPFTGERLRALSALLRRLGSWQRACTCKAGSRACNAPRYLLPSRRSLCPSDSQLQRLQGGSPPCGAPAATLVCTTTPFTNLTAWCGEYNSPPPPPLAEAGRTTCLRANLHASGSICPDDMAWHGPDHHLQPACPAAPPVPILPSCRHRTRTQP